MDSLTADERRIVHRALGDLLHRFVVFDGMQLSEGTQDTAFTLDTAEDQEKVRLVLRLLGFEPRQGVPANLGELHAEVKDRDPELAERIRPFAEAEDARRK